MAPDKQLKMLLLYGVGGLILLICAAVGWESSPVFRFLIKAAVVLTVVFGIPIWLGGWLTEQRRKRLAAWAESRNLTFRPDTIGAGNLIPKELTDYADTTPEIFNVSRGRCTTWDVIAFDVHYQTKTHSKKGGTEYHDHYCSMVAVELPYDVGLLQIRPTGLTDQMKQAMGFDDINVESAEFSRRYHVAAPDKKWAIDFLCPAVVEFMLGKGDITFEANSRRIVAYDGLRSTFSTDQFDANLDRLTGILDRMDRSLVKELSAKP